MLWQIITSISTLLAVLVALFLPAINNRRKLLVEVATPGRFTKQKEVIINIINSGGKFVTISRLLILNKEKKNITNERHRRSIASNFKAYRVCTIKANHIYQNI